MVGNTAGNHKMITHDRPANQRHSAVVIVVVADLANVS